MPANTTPPTSVPDAASAKLTPAPSGITDRGSSNTTTIVAYLLSVAVVIAMVVVACLYRRRAARRSDKPPSSVESPRRHTGDSGARSGHTPNQGFPLQGGVLPQHVEEPPVKTRGSLRVIARNPSMNAMPWENVMDPGNTTRPLPALEDAHRQVGLLAEGRGTHEEKQSFDAASAKDSNTRPPSDGRELFPDLPESSEKESSNTDYRQVPRRDIGIAQATLGIVRDFMAMSEIPGVAEVAGLLVVIMNLAKDRSDVLGESDDMVKRCHAVLLLLQRADSVLKEVGDEVYCGR